jgi:hypothetical protein
MRSFVISLVSLLLLATCTLQSGNGKIARGGPETWNVDGRAYELAETYFKRVGNSVRFVIVSKTAVATLAPDEAKALALPLIRHAKEHRLHERTTIRPLRGNVPLMVGFAVEFVYGEAGKVIAGYDVPGGEVTWRLAHPNDP